MPSTEPVAVPSDSSPVHALFRLLRERRSRRFARGLALAGGPLDHASIETPVGLTEAERARLAFAACGITGWALNDLGLGAGQGGTMMAGLVGRTVPSLDAIQTVALVVTSDDGTWLVRRGADLPPDEVRKLIQLASEENYLEIHRRQSVKLSDRRVVPPLEPPHNIPLNRWNAHAAGTTYFLPVGDITLPLINVALELLDEHNRTFPIDERANFAPAGVAKFGTKRGGHLDDSGLSHMPIREFEILIGELVSVEIGMTLQNLCLAAEALGLGGFPNYAGTDVEWMKALGFRMDSLSLSRFIGAGALLRTVLRLRHLEQAMPVPLGLEGPDGEVLLRPYRPPYFPSIRAAVEAVVERKHGVHGIYRQLALTNSGWRDPQTVTREIAPVSEAAIEATVAFCKYVFERYGRFPAHQPAFRIHMGFQASHLDLAFYDRHYHPTAASERHRDHFTAGLHA